MFLPSQKPEANSYGLWHQVAFFSSKVWYGLFTCMGYALLWKWGWADVHGFDVDLTTAVMLAGNMEIWYAPHIQPTLPSLSTGPKQPWLIVISHLELANWVVLIDGRKDWSCLLRWEHRWAGHQLGNWRLSIGMLLDTTIVNCDRVVWYEVLNLTSSWSNLQLQQFSTIIHHQWRPQVVLHL